MTLSKPYFTSGSPQDPDRPILYFDFVDPASHLVSRMIDRAGAAQAIDWRGLELRPPPEPMIDPGAAEWSARRAMSEAHAGRQALQDTGFAALGPGGAAPGPGFAAPGPGGAGPGEPKSGLDLPAPPIIPWTRKAHELCELARRRDCFHAVRRALFRAHFIDHTDIGRIDLLVEIAQAAGLDPSEARAVLDVDRHAAAVLGNRGRALEAGIRDVPALARPGGWLVGPAVLREIERAIEEMVATTQENPETGQARGSGGSDREE